jgi:acyl carrier protein
MEDVFTTLNQICCEVFESPKLKLKLTDAPIDIDGWDSLTHVILIGRIENHFSVVFNFKELATALTIGDLVRTIETKINKSPSV